MKVKVSEIHPNPYKKWINEGKYNQEQLDRLKASEEELGLMDAIPIVKRKEKYHCVSHHHRVEMLKQKYGKDHEVEVILHDYNDEQLFRGMVVENMTQRAGDFREEMENLDAIRKYLQTHPDAYSDTEHAREDKKGIRDAGSIRDIGVWLNKNGQIMSIGDISQLLKMHDKLSPELLDTVEMTHEGDSSRRGEVLSKTQGILLSTFEDEEEQKDLAKALLSSMEGRVREQSKLLVKYKEAPEEEKLKIRKGEKDLALVGTTDTTYKRMEKSPTDLFNEFNTKLRFFSAEMQGFLTSGVIDELSDAQKEFLQEYLVSFRLGVFDKFLAELGK